MDIRLEIKKCIENNKNFIVNGGAGSGKTYSLINTLSDIFELDEKANVACITYTKVAAQEIRNRIDIAKYNLHVSTIHEFLWANISNFQKTIKDIIIDMYNKKYEEELLINFPQDFEYDRFCNEINCIQYRDYRRINEGILSHDDIIKISYCMFKNYRKICDITNDKYDFILIDEYQDSLKNVVKIFIEELSKIDGKKSIIGFFGDPMQKIYNTGIGEIIDSNIVVINKSDNWRSSQIIVELINKFRNDGIIQVAQGDNKDFASKCTFVYSNSKVFFEVKDMLHEKGLIDKDDDYKELYLTHNLIGKLNGSEDLFKLFSEKEKLIGDNKDDLIKHLEKIESMRSAYLNKRHHEILEILNIEIDTLARKDELVKLLSSTFCNVDCTIEEMINRCDSNNLICKDDIFKQRVNSEPDFYDKLKIIPYVQFVKCYQYANHNSPFSTQHGVKGEEYNNVVVVLDNGNWNMYDYSTVLTGNQTNSKYERSLKIMYVSFSRAKKNLCVYYYKPDSSAIVGAKRLFGAENVIEIN